MRHNLPLTPIVGPDERDSLATFRNAELLRAGNAFLAFGYPAGWPADVEDLIGRAKGVGFNVRVIDLATAAPPSSVSP